MAMAIDSLSILPPELRQCVYSWLTFADAANTVWIKERQDTVDRHTKSFAAALASREDPTYIASRKRPHHAWPDEVEDAFFQGK